MHAGTMTSRIALHPDAERFVRQTRGLFVDGAYVEPAEGGTLESVDPATGAVAATVAAGTAADIDRAVAAARRALPGWAGVLPAEREAALLRFADAIEQHADELAGLDALDSGKPVAQIRAVDLPLALGQLRYFAGYPTKLHGTTVPVSAPDLHVYTRREPVGVVGAIVPWNFPVCQAMYKVAPALAAGCTVVLKPAEQTPLSALRLAELAIEAGLPAGVLNTVTGLGEAAGAALVAHPGVAKIAFTGSEEVGKLIARAGADRLKHVSLELGGKNPHIIFADADLEAAAAAAASAIFFYTGQVCSAGSRLMVERSVHDEVVARIVEAAKALKVGPGLDPDTTMGPLVDGTQRERVQGYVAGALDQGATVAFGGGVPNGELASGFFHEPTVLVDVPDDLTVVREEIFGPVLVAQAFDSVDEVVARANATDFGLAAGVWTRDLGRAHRTAARLEAGTVWINTYNGFDAAAPWGGHKQSGYGRDGGAEGIEKFLQTKTVWAGLA